MKRLLYLSLVVLLVATLHVWSQPRPSPNILRDGGNRTTTQTGRPGAQQTRPTTTAARPATTATRPIAVRPTQETCACVTFASIEHPLETGSLARHVALGGGGYGAGGDIYTYAGNPFIVDSYSYFTNPAYADRFRDAVFANFGSIGGAGGNGSSQPLNNFGGQSFGAIFSLSPRVTIGGAAAFESFPGLTALNTSFASNIAAYGIATSNWYGGTAPPGIIANGIVPLRARNSFYLSTSFNTGDVVLAGGVSYVNSLLSPIATNATQNAAQPTSSLTQLGFNLGVLITTNTASMLDLSVTLLLPRVTLAIPNSQLTQALTGTSFAFNGRYIARLNKNISFIPMVNFYTLSSPATGSITSIDGGLGLTYQTDRLYLVGGVSVSANSGGTTAPLSSEFIFPRFNLGAEIKAVEWLKFRMGYATTTNNRTYRASGLNPDANATLYNNYSLLSQYGAISLGFGLSFGKFNLDLTTDTEVIRRALGGIGTTSSFGYLAATFRL